MNVNCQIDFSSTVSFQSTNYEFVVNNFLSRHIIPQVETTLVVNSYNNDLTQSFDISLSTSNTYLTSKIISTLNTIVLTNQLPVLQSVDSYTISSNVIAESSDTVTMSSVTVADNSYIVIDSSHYSYVANILQESVEQSFSYVYVTKSKTLSRSKSIMLASCNLTNETKQIENVNNYPFASDIYSSANNIFYITTYVTTYSLSGNVIDKCIIQSLQSGSIKRLIVPVKIGEYGDIIKLEDDVDLTILTVTPLPYGLKYDGKKIYGRVLIDKKYEMNVRFSDKTVITIILEPIGIEKYSF